jgi:putative nucleotidyltransferase with HDIG domain
LILVQEIRLSEIIAALSVALDITQGQRQGHCMRSALIGMRIADIIGLSSADRSALFYALLLKDLGCSSNAAKMAYLFAADDQQLKRSIRLIDWTKPGECLKHCWCHCSPGGSPLEKFIKTLTLVRRGPAEAQKISEIRCERGAEIARMLRLPEATARAIYSLDEHWNGRGSPCGLKGEEIPLLSRICCLSQTVEVFFSEYGLRPALDVAENRRTRWFDPQLVDALLMFRNDASFWDRLNSDQIVAELGQWEPADAILLADELGLDRVAEAFAMVVDAKSPWTYQHSTRVAQMSVGVAQELGASSAVQRDLRRAALLHDLGKLGVSNTILDKPGKPTEDEFEQIRLHPYYTQQILAKVQAFQTLAHVAGAHHERLDGRGYHRRLDGSEIHWATKMLTVADIAEAMSAARPYRNAMSWEQIQEILVKDAGKGVDPSCVAALERWYERRQLESRVESQLEKIDRLMSDC